MAYHYIRKIGEHYVMRNGQHVLLGEVITEPEIKMCEHGLHASFSVGDAKKYAPAQGILTRVEVWGKILIEKDKLVATHRRIVEEVCDDT